MLIAVGAGWSDCSFAADVDEARSALTKGEYEACIQMAEQAVQDATWNEEWPILLAKAQLTLGRYPAALSTMTTALRRYRTSMRVRLAAYEVYNANGQTDKATETLSELNDYISSQTRFYLNPPNLVALGKAALLLNADPKLVLENFFDRAKQSNPNYREAYLASGELALSKNDYDLAAKTFGEALKQFPEDPDLQYGLAQAYEPSDRAQMAKCIEGVLRANPRHVPSLLLLVDHAIDAEEYAEADKLLARILQVNPWHPEAWAYRAVLAHVRNQSEPETTAYTTALKYWSTNPRVDFLIGKKLSQKYRFAEGSGHQRQALKFDPQYLPAKIQLAQDLLRLGNETEGWQLAEDVHQRDGYDVTAYNLITLRETLAKFQTLTNRDFLVRMSATEAALYGDQVLALLQRAKDKLSQKYHLQLEQPTTVEIFPEQKDFAVRTFGMPDNPGFLGVCFGHVVTANSPAAQAAHPANWEAVLWHEFCHVVTLQLTHNKMPRWLSEGISVYEERQENPTWGQDMSPRYRQMLLGDDLTPVGKLSSAFMSPKGHDSIQFAYYESALVVEYLVQTYGLDALQAILTDLGQGMEINEALARHTVPLKELEAAFTKFARQRARQLAPGLDWQKPADLEDMDDTDTSSTRSVPSTRPRSLLRWARSLNLNTTESTNYWILLLQAQTAMADKKWDQTKTPLEKLIALYPNQTGPDSAYRLLASVHRALKETPLERACLMKLAALEADASDVYLRLMELDDGVQDWPGVAQNAERFLAVNPLLPQPYRYLARASEALNHPDIAMRSYQRLLMLDPPDPAEAHFRLARLLYRTGDLGNAKRHVLQALEEAPRYREAQRLLLELEGEAPGQRDSAVGATSKS